MTLLTSPNEQVKSIAINPQRTEQLAVGANDPYVRLYDRRMIKLTSVQVEHLFDLIYLIILHVVCYSLQFRPERPSMHWGRRDFLAENCRSEEDRTAIPIDCVQYFSPGLYIYCTTSSHFTNIYFLY